MTSTTQDALAALRRSALVRDDSGPSRVYRDPAGTTYHSVTSILSATQDKSGLVHWAAGMERMYGPGAADQERNVAAQRGTQTHDQAEYFLKTAQRLARATANKRNVFHWDERGLARIPSPITQWALNKVHPKVPKVSWSASGYARGLSAWIANNITEIFASEFAVSLPYGQLDGEGVLTPFTPLERKQSPLPEGTVGFAGTADALIGIKGFEGLVMCDFKTTNRPKKLNSDHPYTHQLGAYSLALEHRTGLRPDAGLIVLAQRCGAPQTYLINREELTNAENAYVGRVSDFYTSLGTPM